MKKKRHGRPPEPPATEVVPSKKPFNWRLLLTLVINTAVIFAIYRIAIGFEWFPVVMWVYLIATAGLAIGYTVYNRGFSRRGITADMLPDAMSAEEKCEFVADGERRARRSKWMLTLLIPLILTFAYDLLELFVFDYFTGLFK